MNGSLNWISLEQVWKNMGRKAEIKVRFNDWSHSIRYFTIMGESEDAGPHPSSALRVASPRMKDAGRMDSTESGWPVHFEAVTVGRRPKSEM